MGQVTAMPTQFTDTWCKQRVERIVKKSGVNSIGEKGDLMLDQNTFLKTLL
jgi:hypothetical protein